MGILSAHVHECPSQNYPTVPEWEGRACCDKNDEYLAPLCKHMKPAISHYIDPREFRQRWHEEVNKDPDIKLRTQVKGLRKCFFHQVFRTCESFDK